MSLQPTDGGVVWSQFTVDPRIPEQAQVRASDADRDLISAVLADAYAQGRLDSAEYNERLGQAMAVKCVGEVPALISDVVVSRPYPVAAPADQAVPSATHRNRALGAAIRTWVTVSVIVNLVWLLTSFGHRHLIYYWPMWPMLGTGIPVLVAFMFSNSGKSDQGKAEPGKAGRGELYEERSKQHRLGS